MDNEEFRESPDIGFEAKGTAVQQQELRVTGTSAIEDAQHQEAFIPSFQYDRQ